MVKLTYDVTDVEDFEPYDGPVPKRGIYEAKVTSAEFGKSAGDNNMWTIIVHIDSRKAAQKQYNGCPLWEYATIGDLSEAWQKRTLKQLCKAFGKSEKGSLDPVAFAKSMVGKKVRVIVKNEEYGGEMTAKSNGLLPFKAEEAKEGSGEPEAEPDAEEEATEEGTEEEGAEEEGAEEEEEGTEEEGTEDAEEETTVEEDIAELDRAGLKEYIETNAELLPGLINDKGKAKVYKTWSDDDIRTKIVEQWPDADEDGGSEQEPPF